MNSSVETPLSSRSGFADGSGGTRCDLSLSGSVSICETELCWQIRPRRAVSPSRGDAAIVEIEGEVQIFLAFSLVGYEVAAQAALAVIQTIFFWLFPTVHFAT